MKRILGIVRSSSERQETESQRKELVGFLMQKGYAEKEIEIIEVAGASARTLNKKYLEMIDSIKNRLSGKDNTIKAVGLWHLNRLGRVDSVLIEMKNWFADRHIQVYVREPSITLLNDDGSINSGAEISWNVFAAMVKQDTKEMFDKFARAKKRNAEAGKYNGGGNIKYGYEVDQNNFFVPNESEAATIRLIFEEYASQKHSIKSLQDELAARGIRLRGRKISQHLIGKILCDTAYIGCKDLGYVRKYPKIVDEELWNAAKSIRLGNTQKTKDKTYKGAIHYALRILKCKYCGYYYIHSHDYYTCFQRAAGFKNIGTPVRCLNSVGVIDWFIDQLLWDVASQCHIDFLNSDRKETIEKWQQKIAVCEEKKQTLKKKMDEIGIRRKRLNELYISDGSFSKEDYELQKTKIGKDDVTIQAEIKTIERQIKSYKEQIKHISDDDECDRIARIANDVLDEEKQTARNEIIHTYIAEAYVYMGELDGKETKFIDIVRKDGKIIRFAYYPHVTNEYLRTYVFNEWKNKWQHHSIDLEFTHNIKNRQKKYKEYEDIIEAEYHYHDLASKIKQMMEEELSPEERLIRDILKYE